MVTPTYPGVYIEEIPSGVRTIVGVATSITAFIGRALRGPVNKPTRIQSFGDFERVFGGLWLHSTLSYAVRHFFLNGGSDAYVVRIVNTQKATVELTTPAPEGPLVLISALEGAGGNRLRAKVEIPAPGPNLFLTIQEIDDPNSASPIVLNEAQYDAPTPTVKELQDALAADTSMVSVEGAFPTALPGGTAGWIQFNGGEMSAANARAALPSGDELILVAATSGGAGNDLRATIIHRETNSNLFVLVIEREQPGGTFTTEEIFLDLSIDSTDQRFVEKIVNASPIVNVQGSAPATRPKALTRVAFSRGNDTGPVAATVSLVGVMSLQARNPGAWGNHLQATVDLDTVDSNDPFIFNLTIEELDEDNNVVASEIFRNLSLDEDSSRYIAKVLEVESGFVQLTGAIPTNALLPSTQPFAGGADGGSLTDTDYQGIQANKTGIYALEDADLFNLLYIPPPEHSQEIGDAVLVEALQYCRDRRAMLLLDPRLLWTDTSGASDAQSGVTALRTTLGATDSINAIMYFPLLEMPDPLRENRTEEFGPCGAAAGIIARTDATRGVWKAPAGIEATFSGVRQLSYKLTDGENGVLNPLGLNCLRTFPAYGNVIWGARTLAGDDRIASEWKYLPVRRLALFIEESLYRGTQWVVFEPNDEPLWAQIRLNIGAFMQNLFRQGAFQGRTPREAYFVKCDKETTTQNDINLGIVNIIVGFAPLKPAEFVIIKIQQMAGQIAA